jgi:hypothetical protein
VSPHHLLQLHPLVTVDHGDTNQQAEHRDTNGQQ